ncbi:cellulose synthase-like protein E6 isoform X2 [Castanea sativa]|uniref:cellulose synthase-like protein E6 isoform X2 n=1 Tax=Castanea sativa TaxID=21020 RepID=UPI003F651BBB
MGNDDHPPLFVTKSAKGRTLFRFYALIILVCTCLIFVYRLSYIPAKQEAGRWAWVGLFLSELWFCFYWFLTMIVRWNPICRCTFKDRLSHRYEKVLPGIDILVCTANPLIEPPAMVINTVLSVMAYDYPSEKLSVYLSDDGGSELTFYAMLEAARFSKFWLPFCKKFKVEPRSPEAYFRTAVQSLGEPFKAKEWSTMKKLYEDMKKRVETTTKQGQLSEGIRQEHKGFSEWTFVASQYDHQTILQILIDGRDPKAVDIEGQTLPTLVYLAREKRPQYHHNFKPGAMNALFPQAMENLTKNDIYSNSFHVMKMVELPGFDGNGGSSYVGSGCFHRRETLRGKRYNKEHKADWKNWINKLEVRESASVLEETCNVLASCTYEENTQWGKEMGLKYGCRLDDIITGLAIQCRGWRSIYFNPKRSGFLGVAPTTLLESLIQQKGWCEGGFQIFASSYCPLVNGHKNIPLKLQLSYCPYMLWAANCLPTLYYVTVPSIFLLRGISLFPEISNPWALPFISVIFIHRAYSLGEFVLCGGTLLGWWNDQRMWLFKRMTSYFFAFFNVILKLLGFSQLTFTITTKVADDDVSQRYEQEVMEFSTSSPMFTILATLAMLNAFCFAGGMKRVIVDVQTLVSEPFILQILLCGLLVLINIPVYQGLFLRKDNGRMPTSVTYLSIMCALLVCTIALY